MDIAEKVLRQKKDFDDVYEAGKKAEYDVFWDGVQDNGARCNYSQAFAYAWNDESFKPKYDIKCTGAYATNQIFFNTKIVDLVGCLKKTGVNFDTTEATVIQGIFDRAQYLINTPPIDAINCKSMQMTYNGTRKARNIEIANIQENCTFDRVFIDMYALTDVILTDCTIGQNGFDIHWSTKLTHDSLINNEGTGILNSLADKSGTGSTWTITLGNDNLAKLTDAEKAIATQKGWTLA